VLVLGIGGRIAPAAPLISDGRADTREGGLEVLACNVPPGAIVSLALTVPAGFGVLLGASILFAPSDWLSYHRGRP
jgi:hypothetical protein